MVPQRAFQVSQGGVSGVPSPATLPLFATGLGMMALLGWRRSRLRLNLTDIIGGHMNRWIMMCLAVAAISIGATGANAGFITQAAFGPSAVTTDLDNLGLQQANYPAPFTVDIYTFTTDDGQVPQRNREPHNSR